MVKQLRLFVETPNNGEGICRGLRKSICMKIGIIVFAGLFSYCTATTQIFRGSTPANAVVKSFLGIPLTDSIDFIRWRLNIDGEKFSLSCNYGIGKQGTNGFINGGKHVEFSGSTTRENSYFLLRHKNKMLWVIEINPSLLHLLDRQQKLLVGNGGWSYTLNGLSASNWSINNLRTIAIRIKDSTVFEGRTPCGVPGVVEPGNVCYKLKWRIVLYTDAADSGKGGYRAFGTEWRQEGGRRGSWTRVNTGKKIIYRLNDGQDKPWLYLQQLDEHILIFTDAGGKLLVGDEDFSYTLNRMK
jgi:hypothetical protein